MSFTIYFLDKFIIMKVNIGLVKGMIKMKWYKSVEFWIGILITMAFFELFFIPTYDIMWWGALVSTIVGMILVLNVIGKLKI